MQNSAAISKFCKKGQFPQLGSKFHSPRKTVGPRYEQHVSNAFLLTMLRNKYEEINSVIISKNTESANN